jgi:hypothetical protein
LFPSVQFKPGFRDASISIVMNSSPQPPDPSEQTVFDAARQIPDPQARAAYLDAACAGNAPLRERVEKLVRAGQRADEFLAGDPLGMGERDRQTILTAPLSEGPGTLIGNYKLLEKLGEGGFGVVYMAEQKQPIKRRVALKIIKFGMDTREVVARFEAERQALALMDHPNIAKVFDAGSTEHPLTPSRGTPAPPTLNSQLPTLNFQLSTSSGPPLFRHGTGPRHQDYGLLRREKPPHA